MRYSFRFFYTFFLLNLKKPYRERNLVASYQKERERERKVLFLVIAKTFERVLCVFVCVKKEETKLLKLRVFSISQLKHIYS